MDYKKLSKIADSNPRTTPDLSIFSLSQKLKKAKHRDTKLEVLEALASDKNNEVRLHVARNPNTSYDILYDLSSDKVPNIRLSVASNPNASADILSSLGSGRFQPSGNSLSPVITNYLSAETDIKQS